jgi:hypothetical protein
MAVGAEAPSFPPRPSRELPEPCVVPSFHTRSCFFYEAPPGVLTFPPQLLFELVPECFVLSLVSRVVTSCVVPPCHPGHAHEIGTCLRPRVPRVPSGLGPWAVRASRVALCTSRTAASMSSWPGCVVASPVSGHNPCLLSSLSHTAWRNLGASKKNFFNRKPGLWFRSRALRLGPRYARWYPGWQ